MKTTKLWSFLRGPFCRHASISLSVTLYIPASSYLSLSSFVAKRKALAVRLIMWPWQQSRWDLGSYWISNRRGRPVTVRGSQKIRLVVPTKRKRSHHCVAITRIVHHEISKLWGKSPVINHFQNRRREMRTIVLSINVFVAIKLTSIQLDWQLSYIHIGQWLTTWPISSVGQTTLLPDIHQVNRLY